MTFELEFLDKLEQDIKDADLRSSHAHPSGKVSATGAASSSARRSRSLALRAVVALVVVSACSVGIALAAGVMSLPTALQPGSGADSSPTALSAQIATDMGATGPIALVASDSEYRFVTIASATAVGGTCFGIRRATSGSPFALIECPKTAAAAADFLRDMTAWHVLGTSQWAQPILGFVGKNIDHILVTTADGSTYTLPVVNGVYAYDGRLDDVKSIAAVSSDGTTIQSVNAPPWPGPKATATGN